MILDTSFLIDLMDGLPEAEEKLKLLGKKREVQFVTAPSLFELWSGIEQSKKPEEEKLKVLAVLSTQTVLSLDKNCAEGAGKIDGQLAKQGKPIEPEDSMIAGIAINCKEPVLTRNVAHFSRIKGLKVETY